MALFAGDLCFNDFNIEDKLQEGGWGRVYSAVHIATNQRVAMKFFGV
jgi:serine/threonine protein kinase